MGDSGSSSTPKAVFLSYAREDSAVAYRIADALRGFAIEVWFDQSELRGGDAWDQKIRKQIKDCALFIPLISQATQSRGEGYFRLEWKLAVERTHLMAEGHPFLVPVALGGLPESGAIVPPEFLKVQWTRFASDVPTPTFIDQIYRLLNASRAAASGPAPAAAGAAAASPSPAKKTRPWSIGSLAALAVAIIVALVVSRRRPQPVATPTASAEAAPAVSDKSIAVLPFANMSEEKDSVYFTDGVQEDILTDLALIHDLRVVSRTSVEQYRDTKKPIRVIGEELHVAYILEGSVRREGNQVRVTGQLIKAGSDEHVWAQAYNRNLTDIFSIQSELAQAIATALAAQITHRENDLLQRRPTQNVAAYELLLKAREQADRADGDSFRKQINLLSSAVDLDPNFALAWGELADVCALAHFNYTDRDSSNLDRAKQAIDRAVALAPDDPATIANLGTYYYYAFRDYQKAAEQYQRLAALAPNNPTLFNSLALIQRRQGHWRESIANARKALALEPNNPQFIVNLAASLLAVGQIDEYLALGSRHLALRPVSLRLKIQRAEDAHTYAGSTAEGDAVIAGMTPEQAASPEGIAVRRRWALELGNLPEFIRLDRQQPYDAEDLDHAATDLRAARVYRAAGDSTTAAERIAHGEKEARANLEVAPENVRYLITVGGFAALRGDKAAAKTYFDRALATMPLSRDAVQGGYTLALDAADLAWCDPEAALAEMERLESIPNTLTALGFTPVSLETSPLLYPLRNSPRAKALAERVAHWKF